MWEEMGAAAQWRDRTEEKGEKEEQRKAKPAVRTLREFLSNGVGFSEK